MFTPISVSLSGPAFSFLLYENTKCRFQEEGFLLGEIVHKETKTITDNEQQQINISRTIKINSVMPCPQTHYFYNGTGKINQEKIKAFLGNQFNKVVAWYKYQKIPSAKFTFRDKIIHRQLSDLFNITPELFSCCILTNEASENASTHLFSQVFVRCHNLGCDKLQISIPNLSEPNNKYKSSEPSSETFNKILGDLKINKNTQGLVVINKIQNALQKHVETLVKDLSESEKYLFELENEVKHLQIFKKVKMKNEDNLDSLNDSMQTDSLNDSMQNDSLSDVMGRDSINDSVRSQTSNAYDNKKRPGVIDTPPEESLPDTQKRTPHKRQASAIRGRGGRKRELKKNSKTDENDLYGITIKD